MLCFKNLGDKTKMSMFKNPKKFLVTFNFVTSIVNICVVNCIRKV